MYKRTVRSIFITLLLTMLIGQFILPAQAAPQYDPTNPGTTGLSAWWSLDETSGTRNDSHGSNHLTDNNTVGYTSGVKSNAATFIAANNESLSISDNAALSMGDISFSVCAWVNLEDKTGDKVLVGKWMPGGDNREYMMWVSLLKDLS